MARIRHLQNAPITEAVVDIRVKSQKNLSVDVFNPIRETLGEEYPECLEQRSVEIQFPLDPQHGAKPIDKSLGVKGLIFKSPQKGRIVQFRIDGYTFNKLKPYTDWGNIFSEALRCWDLYKLAAMPDSIIRIALRYINKIEIPGGTTDLSGIIGTKPPLPSYYLHGKNMTFDKFHTKISVRDTDRNLLANITQATETDVHAKKHYIILDIDAYYPLEIDPSNTTKLKEYFGQLRDFKNEIFFNSITESTAKGYE